MKTYILNLYYPSLKEYSRNVTLAKEFVERIAGKSNYRVVRAGENICTLAFATDSDPKTFQKHLADVGQDQFQYLCLEVSSVPAGWTDQSVFQWLQDRLHKG